MARIKSARMVNKRGDGRDGDDGIVYRSWNHKCRYIREAHGRARSRHKFEASLSRGHTQYHGPAPQDTSAVNLIHSLGMHESGSQHPGGEIPVYQGCLSAPARTYTRIFSALLVAPLGPKRHLLMFSKLLA